MQPHGTLPNSWKVGGKFILQEGYCTTIMAKSRATATLWQRLVVKGSSAGRAHLVMIREGKAVSVKRGKAREFPGALVVRILGFCCRGPELSSPRLCRVAVEREGSIA